MSHRASLDKPFPRLSGKTVSKSELPASGCLRQKAQARPRPRVTLKPRGEAPRREPGLPDSAASFSRTAPAGSVARDGSQSTSHHGPDGIAARAAEVARLERRGRAGKQTPPGGGGTRPVRRPRRWPRRPPGGAQPPAAGASRRGQLPRREEGGSSSLTPRPLLPRSWRLGRRSESSREGPPRSRSFKQAIS